MLPAALDSKLDMAPRLKQVQPALAFAARHLDEDLSLDALADRAGLSAGHLHRVFAAAAGETPKQFTLRLRLGRAAALLLSGRQAVLDIALACGFQSHEVFCRAFRRRFGMSPSAYRERGFTTGADAAESGRHAAMVSSIGPCVRLYHTNENQRNEMTYSITTKEITAQPVLLVRRRVKRSEIAKMIGESLPLVFLHAQKTGAAVAGLPFARYLDWGPGMTMEAGVPVASPGTLGEGDVLADMLPGGLVAATMHEGPYDLLSDAHAAVQQWVEEQGLTPAGAPWESYVTDPGEYPDPKDWKTEVVWPIAPRAV
jgi:AraC family transcriptional regulator